MIDITNITEDDSFEKTCPVCNNVFDRLPGLSDKVWGNRVYCSRVCGYSARRNPKETKRSNLSRRKDLSKTPFYNFKDN